jgi:hypothetical protein
MNKYAGIERSDADIHDRKANGADDNTHGARMKIANVQRRDRKQFAPQLLAGRGPQTQNE